MNVCVDLGTSAVMHRDPNNQLNCVVYDSKRWTLIDMASMSDLPLVWEDGVPPLHNTGGTVEFDFESVDLIRYPSLATIPYAQAVVEEGDCIFIPGSYVENVQIIIPLLGLMLLPLSFCSSKRPVIHFVTTPALPIRRIFSVTHDLINPP
eukprot:m.42317 g.42317  ORF g.42317 m.42317 type:complete len:150 (+) comp6259_c0_seq1:1-450(+)